MAGGIPSSLYRLFCPRCHDLCPDNTCPTCGWPRARGPTRQPLAIPQGDRISTRKGANIGVGLDVLVIATCTGHLLILDRFTLQVRSQVALPDLDPRLRELQVTPGGAIGVDRHHLYLGLSAPHLFGPEAGCLVALTLKAPCKVVWVLRTKGAAVSGPAVWKGTVYAAASNGEAWAVEATTGRPVWDEPRALPGWSPQPPAVDDELAIFPVRGNRIVALDRATGQERWASQALGAATTWLPNTPTIADDRVYLAGWDGCLYCLDRASGEGVHWVYRAESGQGFLTPPVVTGKAVLVGGRDRRLHAVGLDGSGLWEHHLGGAVYSRPLVLGDEVYVAGDDRRLHALNLEDGNPLWPEPAMLDEKVQAALTTDGWHIIAVGRKGSLWRVPRAFPQLACPEQLLRQGKHELAAVAYGLKGNFSAAAEICETRLGATNAAIALYLRGGTAEAVERARDLARQMGSWEREAEALAAVGRYRQAGDVVRARAEQRETATRGQGEEELAGLFERAARYYAQAGLEEVQEPRWTCEAKARYYHRMPDLQIIPELKSASFRVGEVNPLQVRIVNVGRGKAKDVHIRLEPAMGALKGELEDRCQALAGLGGEWSPELDFEPVKAGRITVRCFIRYRDESGAEHRRKQRWEVQVVDREQDAAPTIHVSEGGTMIHVGRDVHIAGGDLIRDQGQKGDRVTVARGGLSPDPGSLLRTCAHCGWPQAKGARFCDQCGEEVS